eukprot:499624_1
MSTVLEEDQYKFNITSLHSTVAVEFVALRSSEYADCQNIEHDTVNCNVIKRILHILLYYHQHPNCSIYEYLSSLKNYDFPTFMEDWHQVK